MLAGLLIDMFVVLIIVSAIVSGFTRGFLRALGTMAGIIIGGAAALVVMPLISSSVPVAGWNVTAAIVVGIFLILIGVSVGEAIAKAIRKPAHRMGLGIIDRLLGAATGLVVSVTVLMMLVMSVGSFGVPGATHAVASSSILRLIEDRMPAPVEASIARLRSLAIDDGIPLLLDSAGASKSEVPNANTDTEALRRAAASVPRIAANAPACRASSTGSGFMIGEGLVMTNAHVVAGARDVVVEAPGELPRTAQVTYFDAETDVAVLAAPGVNAPALPFTVTPAGGSTVFFQGYPYGGPQVTRSAAVLSTAHTAMHSTDGSVMPPRSVARLAGDVNPGNSGGPLLDADGAVVGMIFAQADGVPNIGFALTMEEVAPVIALAPELTSPVSTGACTP